MGLFSFSPTANSVPEIISRKRLEGRQKLSSSSTWGSSGNSWGSEAMRLNSDAPPRMVAISRSSTVISTVSEGSRRTMSARMRALSTTEPGWVTSALKFFWMAVL